jgi:hypothetical protein
LNDYCRVGGLAHPKTELTNWSLREITISEDDRDLIVFQCIYFVLVPSRAIIVEDQILLGNSVDLLPALGDSTIIVDALDSHIRVVHIVWQEL